MTPLENPELFWWITTPLILTALACLALAVVYRVLKNAYDRREEAEAERHGERVAHPHFYR